MEMHAQTMYKLQEHADRKKSFLPLEKDCPHKQWYTEDCFQEPHYLVPPCHPLHKKSKNNLPS